MDSASDAPSPAPAPQAPEQAHPPPPANWQQALMSLVAARVALIQLEAAQTARHALRKTVAAIAAILCVFFGWSLLLAAAVATIAQAAGKPWPWIAFAVAGIHLFAALVLVLVAKGSATPAFPATRAEFQKDREWIENFQPKPKSNN